LWLNICLLLCLTSCIFGRKPVPIPRYPPTPETSVRFYSAPPPVTFLRLGTVAIQAEADHTPVSDDMDVRPLASAQGADGYYFLRQTAYWQRNAQTRQKMRMRRTIYQLVRSPQAQAAPSIAPTP
jgi:hypothetical protein